MEPVSLESNRILLRPWKPSDLQPFAKMNADADVMRYYPSTLNHEESDEFAQRIQERFNEKGWGFWALEHKDSGKFMGFTGLNIPGYDLPCNPCIEVGWRLARSFWGEGFATEAAKASLDFAFANLKTDRIVSFASVVNERSWQVMERLGMRNTHQNFDHPIIPAGHELSEHVLYEIDKDTWQNRNL